MLRGNKEWDEKRLIAWLKLQKEGICRSSIIFIQKRLVFDQFFLSWNCCNMIQSLSNFTSPLKAGWSGDWSRHHLLSKWGTTKGLFSTLSKPLPLSNQCLKKTLQVWKDLKTECRLYPSKECSKLWSSFWSVAWHNDLARPLNITPRWGPNGWPPFNGAFPWKPSLGLPIRPTRAYLGIRYTNQWRFQVPDTAINSRMSLHIDVWKKTARFGTKVGQSFCPISELKNKPLH